eukprot:SM000234S07912  [mRNA]  locus=s234:97896:104816:- [translate_table: standard]
MTGVPAAAVAGPGPAKDRAAALTPPSPANRTCANGKCRATESAAWRKGWPKRGGQLADLCNACGLAYNRLRFCETFHQEDMGWRFCSSCSKRVHCGCVAAVRTFYLLDAGGVECASCTAGRGDVQASVVEGLNIFVTTQATSTDLEMWARLVLQRNLEKQVTVADGGSPPPNNVITQAICDAEALKALSMQKERPAPVSSTPKPCGNVLFTAADMSITDAEGADGVSPSVAADLLAFQQATAHQVTLAAIPPISVEVVSVEKSTATHKSTPHPHSFSNGKHVSGVSGSRPADGSGTTSILWGGKPAVLVFLFEKVLSASDAGRVGRLVLPKAAAEMFFPDINSPEGVTYPMHDVTGREWSFHFRYWPNNHSRMYVLEGVTPFIQCQKLQARDKVRFSRLEPGGQMVLGFKRLVDGSPQYKVADWQLRPINTMQQDMLAPATNTKNGPKVPSQKRKVTGGPQKQQRNSVIPHKKVRPLQELQLTIPSARPQQLPQLPLEEPQSWSQLQSHLAAPSYCVPTMVSIDGYDIEEFEEPPELIPTDHRYVSQTKWVRINGHNVTTVAAGAVCLGLQRASCRVAQEMSDAEIDRLLGLTVSDVPNYFLCVRQAYLLAGRPITFLIAAALSAFATDSEQTEDAEGTQCQRFQEEEKGEDVEDTSRLAALASLAMEPEEEEEERRQEEHSPEVHSPDDVLRATPSPSHVSPPSGNPSSAANANSMEPPANASPPDGRSRTINVSTSIKPNTEGGTEDDIMETVRVDGHEHDCPCTACAQGGQDGSHTAAAHLVPLSQADAFSLDQQPSWENISKEDGTGGAAQPVLTTRHPRHRNGCTCIVCLQAPSGRGPRHAPSCQCQVCAMVRRRFRTLKSRRLRRPEPSLLEPVKLVKRKALLTGQDVEMDAEARKRRRRDRRAAVSARSSGVMVPGPALAASRSPLPGDSPRLHNRAAPATAVGGARVAGTRVGGGGTGPGAIVGAPAGGGLLQRVLDASAPLHRYLHHMGLSSLAVLPPQSHASASNQATPPSGTQPREAAVPPSVPPAPPASRSDDQPAVQAAGAGATHGLRSEPDRARRVEKGRAHGRRMDIELNRSPGRDSDEEEAGRAEEQAKEQQQLKEQLRQDAYSRAPPVQKVVGHGRSKQTCLTCRHPITLAAKICERCHAPTPSLLQAARKMPYGGAP